MAGGGGREEGGGSLELGMLSAGACFSPLFPQHFVKGVCCVAGNWAVDQAGEAAMGGARKVVRERSREKEPGANLEAPS